MAYDILNNALTFLERWYWPHEQRFCSIVLRILNIKRWFIV